MNVQLSTRLARMGSRLATTGLKHREVTMRIVELADSDRADDIAVRRLERERRRLESEIQQYESTLATMSEKKFA